MTGYVELSFQEKSFSSIYFTRNTFKKIFTTLVDI